MVAIRFFAFLFGVVLLAAGFMGFLPQFLVDGDLLFGYFEVSSLQNFIYIAIGFLGIFASFLRSLSKLYFQFFGIIFALTTVYGFVFGGEFFTFHVNMADNCFHLLLSVVALFLGFLV